MLPFVAAPLVCEVDVLEVELLLLEQLAAVLPPAHVVTRLVPATNRSIKQEINQAINIPTTTEMTTEQARIY